MPGQISETVKAKRLAILQKTLINSQIYHNNALIGKTQEVLFERHGRKPNQYIGKNVYLQSVIVESQENLIGQFQDIYIEKAGENSVMGKIFK